MQINIINNNYTIKIMIKNQDENPGYLRNY
jgi:hypothetical protein